MAPGLLLHLITTLLTWGSCERETTVPSSKNSLVMFKDTTAPTLRVNKDLRSVAFRSIFCGRSAKSLGLLGSGSFRGNFSCADRDVQQIRNIATDAQVFNSFIGSGFNKEQWLTAKIGLVQYL